MKVLLCGGGGASQTIEINKLYATLIDLRKPVLYIPVAIEECKFPSYFSWIKNELRPYGIVNIEMLTDIYSIHKYDLTLYSSIFIAGGNTYRLVYLLKDSGAFNVIQNYIKNNGVVIGGSAGAIIFGNDIHCTDYADENIVNLTDTKGFNILNGDDICCHYTNRDKERNNYEYQIITEYANKRNKVFALPEETSLFVEEGKVTVVGSKECTLFTPNAVVTLEPGIEYNL